MEWNRLPPLLAVCLTALAAHAAGPPGVPAQAQPQGDPRLEALATGATVAQTFLGYLEPNATTEFPGTLAWVNGAGATIAGLDREQPNDTWRSLDPDQLVTENAAWWQAYYEIAPADPGLALLQAGSLLCAGDPQRAMVVLRLSLNHKDLDAGSARFIVSVMQHAGAYMEPSNAIVRQGLALHDSGKFLDAIAKYDTALKLWPRNGWALYEKGFSIVANERKRDLPPLTVSLYAKSRKVDPFQWNAWQGVVKDLAGLKEMHAVAQPIWEKCLKDLNYRMTDDELRQFADTLQLAEVDDLALVIRQVLVQHRGRYTPADHTFIGKSLRRLVPGNRTEATLSKLSGLSFKAIRLYEPLDTPKTPEGQPSGK